MLGNSKCGLGNYRARNVTLCANGNRAVHGVYVWFLVRLDKYSEMRKINPVAKVMLQNRRRTQVVPDKKKYNRKKDKADANQNRSNEELENPKG